MRIDTSRNSHQPSLHYRQVVQRQGQVLLDAEWNEQRDIDDHQRHTAVADIVGDSGAPIGDAAFEVTAAGAVLTLSEGRYYLDGVLVENESDVPLDEQPHSPANTPLFLGDEGVAIDDPLPGVYLAELDVWSRLVTALDDQALREVAVPVPDTASRSQTVWQVRMVRVADEGTVLRCGDPLPAWDALRTSSTGLLRARAEPGDESTTPCEIPAGAGYRGPDNQHYRAEIRQGGTRAESTFVWSRENGSVQGRWLSQSGNDLTVSVPARGAVLGFAPDDWIELVDETIEASGGFGPMVQLEAVRGDLLEIRPGTATGPIDHTATGPNPKIRRWEDAPQPLGTGWVSLERGVEIEFEEGTYRTGEFWNIVARTATHDVVWPTEAGVAAFVPAAGPHHSYGALALAEFDGGSWTVLDDCRPLFPPLTAHVSLGYAGGDGQTATPDPTDAAALVALAAPLQVSVTNGNLAVAGETIEFEVIAGDGLVDAGGGPAATVIATTNAEGLAEVTWSLDSANDAQQVQARLVRPAGALDAPITFNASLLHAAAVTLLPNDCPELAGVVTVQQALETLCEVNGDGCATVVLTPGDDWAAPLRNLPPGSAAVICFRPGVYQVTSEILIRGLSHVILDGAGLGSHVNGERLEVLMRFEQCGQVDIRDLRFSSRLALHPGDEPGRGGVLTMIDCDVVTLTNTRIDGAGASRRRSASCVAVQGLTTGTRVTVRDCHLRPGHLQEGILVANGSTVRIVDNLIETARKPPSLGFAQLLEDPERRRRLIGELVSDPRSVAGPSPGGVGPGILVGNWTVEIDSVVDRNEWAARVRSEPPTDEEVRTSDGVRNYMTRIAEAAVADTTTFPAYGTWITNLRSVMGDNDLNRLLADGAGARAIGASLLGPQVLIAPTDDGGATGGRVVVRRGTGEVSFVSPISSSAWNEALRLDQAPGSMTSDALRRALYSIGERVLRDPNFRAQVGEFRRWFAVLQDRNPATATTGVTCAGRLADDVVIERNTIRNVIEAVRVAVSHDGEVDDAPDMAGTVRIVGNDCLLALPLEVSLAAQTILLGNVRRGTVSGNSCSALGAARGELRYDVGIRVHGHLGPQLMVKENLVDHAATGVRVRARSGGGNPHLWAIRDNVAPAANTAVSAPASAVVTDNIAS